MYNFNKNATEITQLLALSVFDKSRNKIDELLIENSIYFVLALALNINSRVGYTRLNNEKIHPANYFGITFASTGDGKDFTLQTLIDCFERLEERYPKSLAQKFSKTISKNNTDITPDSPNYILPTSLLMSLDGTPEGFQKLMQGLAYASGFSANITHGEVGDIILQADMLSRIKEAWDNGSAKGKTTAGGGYFAVKGVPVNVFLYGTPYSIRNSPIKVEKLKAELINGFGRRSFLFYGTPKKIEKNILKDTMTQAQKKRLYELTNKILVSSVSDESRIVQFTAEATQILDDYIISLENEYNSNMAVEINKAIATSFVKIERLSALIAISDNSKLIEPKHIEQAILFSDKTKKHLIDISKGYEPYILIYDLLFGRQLSKIMLMGEVSSLNSKNFTDYISLTREYATEMEAVLKTETRGSITYYTVEPQEKTDLKSVIVSIPVDGEKMERAIDFKPVTLSFFGESHSVESLVKSKVECFTLAHYRQSDMTTYGHRGADFFIEGQNCVAIDVDNGLPLSTALVLLKDYTSIIYTTKSHQTNGKGDRFRIIMPTNKKFFVTADEHKELIHNVCLALGVEQYDKATRNVSRLWFTNPTATVYANKSETLFDISQCLPNSTKSKKMIDTVNNIEGLNLDNRVKGIFLWYVNSTDVGSRNAHLYRAGKMLKELGQDVELYLYRLNDSTQSPLSIGEVKNIIKSVGI